MPSAVTWPVASTSLPTRSTRCSPNRSPCSRRTSRSPRSKCRGEAPSTVPAELPLERFAAAGFGEANHVALGIPAEHLLQLREAAGAAVADGGAEVLQHVADDRAHRASGGDADLHPFSAERLDVGCRRILDVQA